MSEDLRTLLLCRIKNSATGIMNLKTPSTVKAEQYVTVGLYDALFVYETRYHEQVLKPETEGITDEMFEAIRKERNDIIERYIDPYERFSYYHPLHIVRYKYCGDFWRNNKARYLVATILYGIHVGKLDDYENEIESLIPPEVKDHGVSSLIYRSANLSELIILWKGDGLEYIAKGINKLFVSGKAAHMHSLINVNCESIKYDPAPNSEYRIPHVSLSGIVHQGQNEAFRARLEEIKNSLKGRHYITYGRNDFELVCNDVQEKDFWNYLVLCANGTEKEDNEVFDAVRLSLHFDFPKNIPGGNSGDPLPCPQENTKVERIQERVKDLIKEIKDLFSKGITYDWMYSLCETLNMISDMCSNSLLYRIAFLVGEPVQNFYSSILELKDSCDEEKVFADSRESIELFAENLNLLINRIVRVDGYISHNPGFSPMVYNNIPAGLLEFYQAYFSQIIESVESNTLPDRITAKEVNFGIMIIPSLSRRVKIDRVFKWDYSGKTPIFPKAQLKMVSVPYELLYKPEELIVTVTHEIMHFAGETTRCRDERRRKVIGFISDSIADQLDLSRSGAFEKLNDYIKSVVSENDAKYAEIFRTKLCDAIYVMYRDKVLMRELLFDSLNNVKVSDAAYRMSLITAYSRQNKQEIFSFIDAILYLFRECYADLMAIKYLGLTNERYIEFFVAELRDCSDSNATALMCQRMIIVLYVASGCDIDDIAFNEAQRDKEPDTWMESICKETCEVIQKHVDFNNRGALLEDVKYFTEIFVRMGAHVDKKNGFYPRVCLLQLFYYLQSCMQKFEDAVIKTEQNKKSLAFFETGGIKMFDDKFWGLIDESRNKM